MSISAADFNTLFEALFDRTAYLRVRGDSQGLPWAHYQVAVGATAAESAAIALTGGVVHNARSGSWALTGATAVTFPTTGYYLCRFVAAQAIASTAADATAGVLVSDGSTQIFGIGTRYGSGAGKYTSIVAEGLINVTNTTTQKLSVTGIAGVSTGVHTYAFGGSLTIERLCDATG